MSVHQPAGVLAVFDVRPQALALDSGVLSGGNGRPVLEAGKWLEDIYFWKIGQMVSIYGRFERDDIKSATVTLLVNSNVDSK